MKPVSEMSNAELIDEARRRAERRQSGMSLAPTPVELQKRLDEVDARLEKEIQRDVMKLYRAFSCKVYNFSQPRATKQSLGIPDLYVFPPERSYLIELARNGPFWHETKTPTGEQSEEQRDFEILCRVRSVDYVLGGVLAAEEKVIRLRLAERINGTLEPIR